MRGLTLVGLAGLSACQGPEPEVWQGHVEGEFVHLAAPQAGYLRELPVARGERVQRGQTAFVLAADPDAQALDEARARAEAAQDRVQNLGEPRRPSEVAALQAGVRAAQAAQALAETHWRQQEALFQQHFTPFRQLDEARSALAQARAQADASRQQLATFQASVGRPSEQRGAQRDAQAAQAQVAQRQWLLDHKTARVPEAGVLSDTYYRPGEWVPAGAPVVSVLPDTRRRIRFFVPQGRVATLRLGQWVAVSCDGCPAGLRARIDFIAPSVEYTPPVIYSTGSRAKLVFRVEASPAPASAPGMPPGLPVDVMPRL